MANAIPVAEGSITLTGAEQTVYEISNSYGLYSVNLHVAGANLGVFTIKTYVKVVSTGSWVQLDPTVIEGIPASPAWQSIYLAATHGVKWTITKSAGANYDVPWSVIRAV